jgi:type VI secretion system protein ImpE
MNANELYKAGKLHEAVTAALEDVKQHPTDTGKRAFLCELLCFAGDWERADRQLDALSPPEPDAQMGVNLFRQLVRAEFARQQFFTEGRLPEFLDQQITPDLTLRLEGSLLLREGKAAEAAALFARAEEQRPRISGTCNGQPFADLRDLEDRTASFFEVLTSAGAYCWVPLERVDEIDFRPPTQLRDLLWRSAHMSVRDGAEGDVFFPVLYAGSAGDADDQVRLGRATEWRGDNDGPVRGFGQRIFLADNEDRSILELQSLKINPGN